MRRAPAVAAPQERGSAAGSKRTAQQPASAGASSPTVSRGAAPTARSSSMLPGLRRTLARPPAGVEIRAPSLAQARRIVDAGSFKCMCHLNLIHQRKKVHAATTADKLLVAYAGGEAIGLVQWEYKESRMEARVQVMQLLLAEACATSHELGGALLQEVVNSHVNSVPDRSVGYLVVTVNERDREQVEGWRTNHFAGIDSSELSRHFEA